MNLMYITMNKQETAWGCLLLVLYFAMLALFAGMGSVALFLCCLSWLLLEIVFFRRFIMENLSVPLVTAGQIIGKAVLGTIITQLSALLTNDLIYYFLPEYFVYTEWGPLLDLIVRDSVADMAQQHYLLTAVSVILLLPIVEELLFRGLLFGSLYRRSRIAAFLVTLVLFTLIRILPLAGHCTTAYLVICSIQYIPMTIYLSWIYTHSETILTPVLAHMIINGIGFSMLR